MKLNPKTFLSQAACCCLALPFFGITTGFAEDCASKPVASVNLTLMHGQVLVPAKVNGTEETMLLDTGAGGSALRDSIVEMLNIPRSSIALDQASDVGGHSFSQAASVQSLEIGGIELHEMQMLITPRPPSPESGDAGIIGADFLHHYDVDLDFPKRKITFFTPGHCLPSSVFVDERSTSMPLRIAPGGHLYLPMALDGKNLEGLIDTGAALSILTLDAFHRRFGLSDHSDGVTLAGVVSGADRSLINAYHYGFRQLTINDVQFENPTIALISDETRRVHRVADFGSPNVGLPDLILGMSELAALHIYISYADSVIYVAKP